MQAGRFLMPMKCCLGKKIWDRHGDWRFFQPFARMRVRDHGQLVLGIVQALVTEDMTLGVLPDLHFLSLAGYRKFPSVEKAAEEFVGTRDLSGRIVNLSD